MKTPPTTEQIDEAIEDTKIRAEMMDVQTYRYSIQQTNLFALQFLKLAMGEPSVEVIKVGVLAACPSIVGGGDYYPFKSYEVPYSFKAMRDKLLEKAGE